MKRFGRVASLFIIALAVMSGVAATDANVVAAGFSLRLDEAGQVPAQETVKPKEQESPPQETKPQDAPKTKEDKKARQAARKAKPKPAAGAKKAKATAPAPKARPESFTLAIRAHWFGPTEIAFKDVYGGGFAFGAEATGRVWKGLDVWVDGSSFAKTGNLTYTGETTKVRITPFGLGVRYGISRGAFRAYAGAGLAYYQFRETNVIGDISAGGLGWKVLAGVRYAVFRRFFADARAAFTHCDIEPSGIKVNIGGFEFGLGIGYIF